MEEKILSQLKNVLDPELDINVVDLGLIYEISPKEDQVQIKMTATTPFCPYLPKLLEDVEREVGKVKGVKDVEVEIVWDPPWSPQKMSSKAKAQLGILS